MKYIGFDDNGHKFNKQNLVTLKGGIDMYACTCGIKGKRYGVADQLEVTEAAFKKANNLCLANPNVKPTPKPARPTKVKITHCTAVGEIFSNLTPESEHTVVDCPVNEDKKFKDDVWVMGVGVPVRLLSSEYKVIE